MIVRAQGLWMGLLRSTCAPRAKERMACPLQVCGVVQFRSSEACQSNSIYRGDGEINCQIGSRIVPIPRRRLLPPSTFPEKSTIPPGNRREPLSCAAWEPETSCKSINRSETGSKRNLRFKSKGSRNPNGSRRFIKGAKNFDPLTRASNTLIVPLTVRSVRSPLRTKKSPDP